MSRYRVRHDNFTLEVSRHALDRLWERTPLSWRERKQAFEAVIAECKPRALKPNDVLKFEVSGIWWTIGMKSMRRAVVITALPSDWVETDYSMSEWL